MNSGSCHVISKEQTKGQKEKMLCLPKNQTRRVYRKIIAHGHFLRASESVKDLIISSGAAARLVFVFQGGPYLLHKRFFLFGIRVFGLNIHELQHLVPQTCLCIQLTKFLYSS